ncbi:MAG: galactokinase, partial [Phycisphaerae bacterium]|nr:galactokinase [Phycisphaerae bacterium]
ESPGPSPLAHALACFADHFDATATHAARAPGRVNLIGEHTDYNEGFVLPLAIDRDTVVVARPNHSRRCRVVAADLEGEMTTFLVDDSLAPGRTRWANYVKGVVRQFIDNGHVIPTFDAVVASNVPPGAGLSSSAALEVAVATILEQLMGIRLEPDRKARWCQQAEHQFAGVPCGIMDQTVCIQGQRDHALLLDCRSHETRQIALDRDRVSTLVTDSGVRHELADGEYAARREQCEQAVAIVRQHFPQVSALRDVTLRMLDHAAEQLGPVLVRRARHVITANQRTLTVAQALDQGEYETAGFLMNESHRFLRDDYQVSCEQLDLLADLAQHFPGVHGSRMTGGGFGGCTVTLVRPDAVADLARHLETRYEQATGRRPTCFTAFASDGARPIGL